MNREVILKEDFKNKIKNNDKDKSNFLFRLENEKNTLILYVNKLFYSSEPDIQNQIIETVLSSIYINTSTKKLKKELGLKGCKKIENNLMLYFLTTDQEIVKVFNVLLEKHGLKEKFIKLFLSQKLTLILFKQFLIKNPKIKNDQVELENLFNIIKNQQIDLTKKGVIFKSLSLSEKTKGDIFQVLCARLIFNKKDSFYYNINSGEIDNLYPDLMYKINNNIFICDSKCYKNDDLIKPHKELLYNILVTHENKNDKDIIGLVFTYEKEVIEEYFKIKKIYKLAEHYIYFCSLNIQNLLENLTKDEKVSYATEIGNYIIKNHSLIENSFNEKKMKVNIDKIEIELRNYQFNDSISNYINDKEDNHD